MSLNLNKLERVVELANGVRRARCPACAEQGQDKKGQHLRLSPDGKYGCCVFPGDREHRRRIFALAGERTPGPGAVKVKLAPPTSRQPLKTGILGRLGRVFQSPNGENDVPRGPAENSDASDGSSQLQDGKGVAAAEARTLRTPFSNSRVYAEEIDTGKSTYKEFGRPVRSVREQEAGLECPEGVRGVREGEGQRVFMKGVGTARPQFWSGDLSENAGDEAVPAPVKGLYEYALGEGPLGTPKNARTQEEKLPYLMADGTLRIPFDSPERYHWWKKGGQSVAETLAEIQSRKAQDRTQQEQQNEQELFYGDAS